MKELYIIITPGRALLSTACYSNYSVAAGTELAAPALSRSNRY